MLRACDEFLPTRPPCLHDVRVAPALRSVCITDVRQNRPAPRGGETPGAVPHTFTITSRFIGAPVYECAISYRSSAACQRRGRQRDRRRYIEHHEASCNAGTPPAVTPRQERERNTKQAKEIIRRGPSFTACSLTTPDCAAYIDTRDAPSSSVHRTACRRNCAEGTPADPDRRCAGRWGDDSTWHALLSHLPVATRPAAACTPSVALHRSPFRMDTSVSPAIQLMEVQSSE